jgi:hypothetical protein
MFGRILWRHVCDKMRRLCSKSINTSESVITVGNALQSHRRRIPTWYEEFLSFGYLVAQKPETFGVRLTYKSVTHEGFFDGGCGECWNTFNTRGRCPGCGHQWRWTACLNCSGWSLHEHWYEIESKN